MLSHIKFTNKLKEFKTIIIPNQNKAFSYDDESDVWVESDSKLLNELLKLRAEVKQLKISNERHKQTHLLLKANHPRIYKKWMKACADEFMDTWRKENDNNESINH